MLWLSRVVVNRTFTPGGVDARTRLFVDHCCIIVIFAVGLNHEISKISWSMVSVVRRSVNASWHSFNPKHCAHRIQVWTEYRKEHVAKVNCVNKDHTLVYRVLLLQSFTFSVLAYKFCWTWIPGAILEELSNQCRSKKISDEEETKETEPDVLQRQWNKGAKGWKSGGRGIMPGPLLKLLVKDELLHSGKVPINTELRPWGERDEERKFSDMTL